MRRFAQFAVRLADLCGKIESMKIFAFEYALASGACGDTFLKEGRLMLVSLLEELAAARLGEISTLVNSTLDRNGITPERPVRADETVVIASDFFSAAKMQMEFSDVVWIVAPESSGILYRLTDMAERLGKKVMGSGTDAVKLCGDKLLLARFMDGKIEMPNSIPFTHGYDDFPCVVKPVDGAGSENSYFVRDKKRLRQIKANGENYLIEPYVEGEKLSAGIVSDGGAPLLLGVCRQEIDLGEQIKFKNVTGPIDYPNRDKLIEMIEKINLLIPTLRGYYGIDFIDCDGQITLIEINPRLTSSYPIYVKACRFNIAERVVSGMAQTWAA